MKTLAVWGIALLAVSPAAAMQANAQGPVVLRARGQVAKDVTIGKPLPTAKMLTLRAGDVLMLLDGKGVRTLAGPGTLVGGMFTRSGPAVTSRDRIGGMRGSGGGRPRVASVRGLPSNAWAVDLSSTSAVCLPADKQLVLWRPDAATATVEVQPTSGEAKRVEWSGEAQQAEWPQDLSTGPGARYRLIAPGAAREISFRPFDPTDPACAGQIELNADLAAAAGGN